MSAGEISDPREKLFASTTGRSMCSGPDWSFTSGERRHQIGTCLLRHVSILSDNGTQFQSPSWTKTLADHNLQVRFTPIRHPQANHSDSE